jgi:phosphoglycolate phosphatase
MPALRLMQPPRRPYNTFMHILLFDIDGTLIRSGGAGKDALESALAEVFGLEDVRDGVPYSGRTDTAIARELLAVHGIEPSEANLLRLKEAYLERLPQSLRAFEGIVLPGVVDLLNRLRGGRAAVGLLTGNIRRGAEHKLRHFGIWEHFGFGGFGDDTSNRDDVARAALRETERHLKRQVNPRDVWVIGDTPLDVQCARAIGARAVAVCTGWHCLDELHACGPDWVLNDLSDTAALLAKWG